MIKDLETATNTELEEEINKLTEKFEATKAEIYNKYVLLQHISDQYEEIKKVIDKRNGKG